MTTDTTPYTFPDNRRGTVAGVLGAARDFRTGLHG